MKFVYTFKLEKIKKIVNLMINNKLFYFIFLY